MLWALEKTAFDELCLLRRSPPTGDQLTAFHAAMRSDGTPDIYSSSDGVATITIEGVLTPAPYYYSRGTTYRDIATSLRMAAADPQVRRVVLRVNSPGGAVPGLFELVDQIEAFAKPIESVVGGMAASAAYALAAATGRVTAQSRASPFGSVGVAIDLLVFDEEVSIASTKAPNKRPDPRTEEGKKIIQAELDEVHALLVEHISKGRGVSPSTVDTKFGKGGIMLADRALANGLIDQIGGQASVTQLPAARRSSAAREPSTLAASLAASLDQSGSNTDRARRALELMQASGLIETEERRAAALRGDRDLGDAVAELRAARREGREPAPWVAAFGGVSRREGALPAPAETTSSVGDLGDRIVALRKQRRANP